MVTYMIGKLLKIVEKNCTSIYYYIRKKTKKRTTRKLVLIVLSPFLLLLSLFHYIYSKTFEPIICYKKSLNSSYENNIAIAAIMKNEGLYIKEWINYHILLGITKFYLYDNESSDDVKKILEPYIQKGMVEYTYWPGRAKQLDAYIDALHKGRGKSKYILFIDLDEFLVLSNPDGKLFDTIENLYKMNDKTSAIAINWYVYGSSGYLNKPEGLVIENYKYRAPNDAEPNRLVKLIANPWFIKGFYNPHSAWSVKGYSTKNEKGKIITSAENVYPDNSYDYLRINHYYCKSQEETKIKFARGLATDEIDIKRKWSEFERFDRNEIYDYILEPYVEKVKESMKCYEAENY